VDARLRRGGELRRRDQDRRAHDERALGVHEESVLSLRRKDKGGGRERESGDALQWRAIISSFFCGEGDSKKVPHGGDAACLVVVVVGSKGKEEMYGRSL
jgi:hypothetical protein